MNLRATIKRLAPGSARRAFAAARGWFAPPPVEADALHDYEMVPDPSPDARLSLVIPSVAPRAIFGGVATGVDFLFAAARALGMKPRVVVDDFNDATDVAYIERAARRSGFRLDEIEFVRRTAQRQPLTVRRNDLFLAYNCWMALNLRGLLERQKTFYAAQKPLPLLYILQDYEAGFYSFSATHMLARASLDGSGRIFGIFNSYELHAYFRAQGHQFEREFVIPLRMSKSLKAARSGQDKPKDRRILVYGRPNIARNCFSSIVAGLKAFVSSHPEFSDWRIESAGGVHAPVDLGGGKTLVALGKLSLEDYAGALESAAVGLSLMASPHPSYPPLEMAHFGMRVVTNGYACKDLSRAHENILSIRNILPETIAEALAAQCRAFLADPRAGWRGESLLPDYLSDESFPFMAEFVEAIKSESL